MYSVTQAFRDALVYSHEVTVRAELLAGGTVIDQLPVHAGSIEVDGSASIRRRCTIEVADATGDYVPDRAGDLITPFGNEVRLYRGIIYPDGAEEVVPLGVFMITAVDVKDTATGPVLSIEGYDRARKVERARFTTGYVVTAGANYAAAIRDLLRSRVPTIEFSPTDYTGWAQQTTRTTPQLVFQEQEDPWRAARSMAASIGRQLFFNPDGVCVMPVEPFISTSAVTWTYAEGEEATILALSNRWQAEGVYNHVIVTGETTTNVAPVRGEAYDGDPASPTYIGGPMGDVPYFYASPLITSTAQANEAAESVLRRVTGSTEIIAFPAIVNPAHEAGDIVAIVREASKVNDLFILDRLTIPLSPAEPMSAVARRQR